MSRELDEVFERLTVRHEQLRELMRQARLSRGENPDPPVPTLDEIRAETIRLRAENDQRAAALRDGWL